MAQPEPQDLGSQQSKHPSCWQPMTSKADELARRQEWYKQKNPVPPPESNLDPHQRSHQIRGNLDRKGHNQPHDLQDDRQRIRQTKHPECRWLSPPHVERRRVWDNPNVGSLRLNPLAEKKLTMYATTQQNPTTHQYVAGNVQELPPRATNIPSNLRNGKTRKMAPYLSVGHHTSRQPIRAIPACPDR